MERYYSFPAYCKEKYGRKLYRAALDAHMTCPNRDGTLGTRGCIFCDEGGSGDFAVSYEGQRLTKQDLVYNHQDAPAGDYIAYFQSYTNTYAPVERLRFLFESAMEDPMFAGISIATRPDCLGPEVIALLDDLHAKYPDKILWVELGLQTMHERTAAFIRRGYPLSIFDEAVKNLHSIGAQVIVHVIIGLPNEDENIILETIDHLNEVEIDGVKLQLLHYLKGTDLGRLYLASPDLFHVLSIEEYVSIIADCIARLDPSIVVNRLTGDGAADLLLAPLWSKDKRNVLNQINHKLKEENITQGCRRKKA